MASGIKETFLTELDESKKETHVSVGPRWQYKDQPCKPKLLGVGSNAWP